MNIFFNIWLLKSRDYCVGIDLKSYFRGNFFRLDMRLFTLDDFIDTYCKIIQRGSAFFFSKFTLSNKSRTKSAFDDSAFSSSNWWLIPEVKKRWNRMITGDPAMNYKQFLHEHFTKGQSGLRLLSLGSGVCSHELELAGYPEFAEIVCLDLAQNLLDAAEKQAKAEGKTSMKFICADIKNYDFPKGHFDFVLFNASLHHFENVEKLLANEVDSCLKPGGKLIINEYVGPNRQQFPTEQLEAINNAIALIDKPLRKRFKTNVVKNKFRGAGWLRMIVADPSECVDSESILPAIHKHFTTILEKPFGGNILVGTLKDIAHHFVTADDRAKAILDRLFAQEDQYLQNHASDYVFGIYSKQ